jgi:DNA-binding LytR/AlgR family response regulator
MKSLNQYEKELPFGFFRCHRSAIVNMTYICSINEDGICMEDDLCLPLSKSKKLLLQEKLAHLDALAVPLLITASIVRI